MLKIENYTFDSREKMLLFIDGNNLYSASKSLEFDIDYKKLKTLLQEKTYLLRAYYFTSYTIDDNNPNSGIQPLLDWLEYNGFALRSRVSSINGNDEGRKNYRQFVLIDMVVEAMQMADKADHFVIASGDGSLYPLVEALQRMGKKVTILSTLGDTGNGLVSDDLRRTADNFIDLKALMPFIARDKVG